MSSGVFRPGGLALGSAAGRCAGRGADRTRSALRTRSIRPLLLQNKCGVQTFSFAYVSRRLAYQVGEMRDSRCNPRLVETCSSAAGLHKRSDSLQRRTSGSRESSDGRHRGSGSRRVRGPCPSGDRVQAGHDLRPSSPHKTAVHRGEVQPIEHLHRAASSSSLHAIYSGGRPDTSNRLPTRTPGLGLGA